MFECSGAGGSDREEKITLHPLALPWIVSVCERIPDKKNPCRNIQQWRKCALLYKSKFETNKIAADQKQGSEAYLETRKKSKMELCAEIVLQKFNANILSIFSFFLLFCGGGRVGTWMWYSVIQNDITIDRYYTISLSNTRERLFFLLLSIAAKTPLHISMNRFI